MNSQLLVLDLGLFQMKIGFSGDEAPRYTNMSCVGYPKNEAITSSQENRQVLVGENALKVKNFLNLKESINTDYSIDFSTVEKVLHELFYAQMKVNILDFPVFVSMNSFFTYEDKHKLIEVFFEHFNLPSLFFTFSGVTGIYSEGRTNGIIIDSGHSGSSIIQVFEGLQVDNELICNRKGGIETRKGIKGITDRIIQERCLKKENTKSHHFDLYGFKLDFTFYDELKKTCFSEEEIDVTLPDGSVVKFTKDDFASLNKENVSNCGDLLLKLFETSKNDYMGDLKEHVYVQGGNTLFPGYEESLSAYLIEKKADGVNIIPRNNDEKMFSSWIGSSIYASLETTKDILVSKSDFNDQGADYIIKKNLL